MPATYEAYTPGGGAVLSPAEKAANVAVTEIIRTSAGGNTAKLVEILGHLGIFTAAGAAGHDPALELAAFQQNVAEIDERYNSGVWAQKKLEAMESAGNDPTTQLLTALDGFILANNAAGLTCAVPGEAKKQGHILAAERHVRKACTDPDTINAEAYITANEFGGGVRTEAFRRLDDDMKGKIRGDLETRRQARVAEVTQLYKDGKMTRGQVEALILKAGINPETKKAYQELIKDEKAKEGAGTEAVSLKSKNPDDVRKSIQTTAAYLSATPEVKAAIDADIAAKKKEREENTNNNALDQEGAKIAERLNQVKYWTANLKEYLTRAKLMLKGGGGLALLLAIGAPAIALAGGGGISMAAIGWLAAGGAVGGAGMGLWQSRYSQDVLKLQQEKINALKARNSARADLPSLQAEQQLQLVRDKVAAVTEYARYYSSGRGYDIGLVTQAMLEKIGLKDIEALIKPTK